MYNFLDEICIRCLVFRTFNESRFAHHCMNDHPVVLFDGICNFCNGMINFIIRQDRNKILHYTPLQSAAGKKLLDRFMLSDIQTDSFILIDGDKLYKYSTAALRLYNKLPWYWKWTQIGWIFPRFIRDGVYNFIARNRYKWFGKREQCMIPSPEIRERFLT